MILRCTLVLPGPVDVSAYQAEVLVEDVTRADVLRAGRQLAAGDLLTTTAISATRAGSVELPLKRV